MSSVVVISGSPSRTSKTERIGDHVAEQLAAHGWSAEHLRLRTLPPEALLSADTGDPQIAEAVAKIADAKGIVLATPTYKASFSGLLKVFLDLLPQFAFAGKAVLPLATGGTIAHVLALDYGLRPVVHSLGPRHVVQSYFLLDRHLSVAGEDLLIDPESRDPFDDVVQQFRKALHGIPHETALGRTA
ncbi:NADPH-dependent FMN reductase [Saccharopolyspora rosea]|uniref:NADPH-dependent FMN reductase n=1 Tax=Saccharopolyspora rosea TaxID=524884 RepID=A0ABW3FRQ6_9PSEU|nr:NADPH-dependent FMN reductase [Saccharopolyspora rosea]